MILLIDNYDSFAHNLARYFRQLDMDVTVIRNDQWSISEIRAASPQAIVISPGPCTPNKAGICLDVVREFENSIPMFGVCLGHQVICQAFGGSIIPVAPVHGRCSPLVHQRQGLFADIPSPMVAGRYHSLVVDPETVPNELQVIALSHPDEENKIVMAVKHRQYSVYGVQFHPESILTEHGYRLIGNFLRLAGFDVAQDLIESLNRQLLPQTGLKKSSQTRPTQSVSPHGWS